jgi:hypothetical protein
MRLSAGESISDKGDPMCQKALFGGRGLRARSKVKEIVVGGVYHLRFDLRRKRRVRGREGRSPKKENQCSKKF